MQRVRSTQKLPIVRKDARANPRISATATVTGSPWNPAATCASVLPRSGSSSFSAPPRLRRFSVISGRSRASVAGSSKRAISAARPPSCAHKGTSEATRLVPEASHGYWSAVTACPARRAASIFATIPGACPCTCTPGFGR